MTHEHDHDDTVGVERDSGSGMGAILGILGVLILLAAVWYFALGPGAATQPSGGTENPPAETTPAPLESVMP